MSSTDVAVQDTGVPALADTPATTIGIEDIALPVLTIAQRTSGVVDNKLADYGDLVISQGRDDPEPTIVRPYGESDGVLFIPLHMFKTWTYSDGENLQSWPYTADGQPPAEAVALSEETGKPVFRTYNYTVLVPDYDTELPVIFRLNSRSQRPAANKINLKHERTEGGWTSLAFRVTTKKNESGANKWAIPIVTEAKATAAQRKDAERVLALIMPGLKANAAAQAAASTVPAI